VGLGEDGNWVYIWDASLDPIFQDVANTEYFVQITSLDINCPNGPCGWGWHETPDSYLDDPATAVYNNPNWQNYCPNGAAPCNDLAFVLWQAPEPGSLLLFGSGLAILGAMGGRKLRLR
jgi:hypothetical protein